MSGAGDLPPKGPRNAFVIGWRVEVPSVRVLTERLGSDLLHAFCRCFVHCDRLTSLANLVVLSGDKHGPLSVTFGRDFQTATWLSIGTLRELALAVRRLRTALAHRGWLGPDMGPLQQLWEIEKRWEDHAFHREVRSKGAFHVDEDTVRAGLKVLAGESQPVCIAEGDADERHRIALTLGSDAVFLGLGARRTELRDLIRSTVFDQNIGLVLQKIFIAALQKGNIPATRRPRIIRRSDTSLASNKRMERTGKTRRSS